MTADECVGDGLRSECRVVRNLKVGCSGWDQGLVALLLYTRSSMESAD